ncbi:ETX/MTX2 family pore-forming toxin [Virgibacillus sp. Bac330]|uniref:ETX/MTX2 family pore-forming toxin n=1 Tax=Virgibacillus sp. Bac330 TaxID=2419841 RepID=UPI000EF484EB|nr:ETX/MTX2 family pore-forming toxin [Virgibacillus sp. Bac330]
MAIIDLLRLTGEAGLRWLSDDGLEYPRDYDRVQLLWGNDTPRIDPPGGRITSDTPPRTIVARKEITNNTDRPSEPQTITFERTTENVFRTETTEGYEVGTSLQAKASTDVFFGSLDITVSTNFKFNVSTTQAEESKESITWREEIPIVVPPRTKTRVDFIIEIGEFDQLVPFILPFAGFFRAIKGTTVVKGGRLTEPNSQGRTIAQYMEQLGDIKVTKGGLGVFVFGETSLSGALGIESNTVITNFPLPPSNAEVTIDTIEGQSGPRSVYF